MRRGILSDAAIRRMHPESFVPDSLTHQRIYHDGVDIHRHALTGIKRPKTPHGHLKSRPRRPLYDLFLQSQAVDPLTPQPNKALASTGVRSKGIHQRTIRQMTSHLHLHVVQDGIDPQSETGDRQMYIDRFDAQYQNLLNVARIDARTKIFIELAGLDPFNSSRPSLVDRDHGSRPATFATRSLETRS